jgi:hypothetical protein
VWCIMCKDWCHEECVGTERDGCSATYLWTGAVKNAEGQRDGFSATCLWTGAVKNV